MAKFLFLTQAARLASYKGPSGFLYVINIGIPFKVDNSDDIDFFKGNKRFKEVKLFTKVAPPPKPDEEIFKDELKALGLLAKSVKKISDLYINKKNLVDHLEQGYKLDRKITRSESKLLTEYVGGG